MKIKLIASLFVFTVATLFALFTDHRWEDWYITYKSAKNLALGNGLVYHIGERVMTYTSPLGVLIPAFIKWIFIDKPDDYVIWTFRFFNILLLSIVPFFIVDLLQKLKVNNILIYISILLISFNILIIDNTINGMESAFMVFFISYLIWVLFTTPKKLIYHLALCFAGLMYSRPDGFIYGGAIVLCFLIFTNAISGKSRLKFITELIKAVLIALVIYLPWFLWTWMYYDTPVPHTVIAKSVSKSYDLVAMFIGFLAYNFRMLTFQSVGIASLFMPAYSWAFGTWGSPISLNIISSLFGLIVSYYWLYPKGSKLARILSLAVYIVNFYLARVSGQGAMPWYLPSVILPSILCLIFITHHHLQTIKDENKTLKNLIYSLNIFLVIYCVITFSFGAIQMKAHQNIIEVGNRQKIGLWLQENARKGDRVFMECLGYIGFYSELKTLDYPGMSSPEVVEARKQLNEFSYDLPKLVYILKPEWLVLREWEYFKTKEIDPEMFNGSYRLVKKFDVTDEVKRADLVFGEGYLYQDVLFYVFKLREGKE